MSSPSIDDFLIRCLVAGLRVYMALCAYLAISKKSCKIAMIHLTKNKPILHSHAF